MDRHTQLLALLQSKDLRFLMGAHDAVSAKIAEASGFEGIWLSGLCLSVVHGVRDANELSWTQMLEQAEFMADAVNVPILVDADSGFGDFNNVRLLTRRMMRMGIAGICVEDKLFPKTNSFIGANQELEDAAEFCGKIRAAKDTVADNVCFVARCEALVAEQGMSEALDRCARYVDAGADAILIHSKKPDADEVLSFMKQWQNKAPVVIVPTKYYKTPTEVFRRAGVSVVIWANQSLRASVKAMRDFCGRLQQQQSLSKLEEEVAPLDLLFELNNNSELELAKIRYRAS